jgi:hypothetical protein
MRGNGLWAFASGGSGISKGVHKRIMGQVMDLNYLTWIFNLCFVEWIHFAQFSPPNPSHVSIFAPTFGTCILVQGGGGHLWQLWDFGCWERVLWWRGTKTFQGCTTFDVTIIVIIFNLKYCGYFVTPTQGINYYKDLGIGYWSCGYKRWSSKNMKIIARICWLFCF